MFLFFLGGAQEAASERPHTERSKTVRQKRCGRHPGRVRPELGFAPSRNWCRSRDGHGRSQDADRSRDGRVHPGMEVSRDRRAPIPGSLRIPGCLDPIPGCLLHPGMASAIPGCRRIPGWVCPSRDRPIPGYGHCIPGRWVYPGMGASILGSRTIPGCGDPLRDSRTIPGWGCFLSRDRPIPGWTHPSRAHRPSRDGKICPGMGCTNTR